jgi:hypothetical protein
MTLETVSLVSHTDREDEDHMTRRISIAATLAALLLMVLSATASAAAPAPPNDGRDQAAPLGALPVTVSGTTVGATVDPNDPQSGCAQVGGSVWYQLTTGATVPSRLAVQVDAHGELDAAVDVFIKQRSQNEPVTCQRTDSHGEAVFAFHPQATTTYLIRVAQLSNSDSGSFQLRAFLPPAPATPPGAPLAAHGASGALERVVDVSSAYSTHLTAGVSYAVNLVSSIQGCMGLSIYGPGVKSLDTTPVTRAFCQGYRLFTPQVSGLYTLLVRAAGSAIGRQPYHLQLARATAAQTAPGLPLVNYAKVHARLDGAHVGVVRLYRFDVTARSNLDLDLHTGPGKPFNLELRSAGGRVLQCACGERGSQSLTAITRPGRYYVSVRARDFSSGGFTLTRRSRVITHAALRIDGSRYLVRPPGDPVTVSVFVSAGANGPASVVIDRLDPVSGWQYNRTVRVRVADGVGSFTFTPPSVGQWAARASFLGSHDFSPSESRASRVLSAGPLSEVFEPR